MEVTAQRIAGAKFWNAGQTCVAPDYVVCVGDEVVDRLVYPFKNPFYNPNAVFTKISSKEAILFDPVSRRLA